MTNRLWRYLTIAVLCIAVTGGTYAASATYSDQVKRVKAGVAVLGTRPENTPPAQITNPFVFHILNQRQDLKPAGWDFYNPIAPTHVTKNVHGRWSVFPEGATVTEDMACYWEVWVSKTPFEDLAQFDVLLLPGRGGLRFIPEEREKLRKFVDSGGVLWIEGQGAQFSTMADFRFFIHDVQTATGTAAPPVMPTEISGTHSLLNRPFLLNWTDINKIGSATPSSGVRYVSGDTGVPDPRYFATILQAHSGEPVLSVAQYGSGQIVLMGEGVSKVICDAVGWTDGRCGAQFMTTPPEDLKLAYNICSLGSEHTTFQRKGRHQGYSFGQVGAPLSELWRFMTPAPGPTASSPAMLDDMVFYVDNGGMLYAFELSPQKDRDGDGNPDDGTIDDPSGAPFDTLWSVPLDGPTSPPTVAYVPVGGGMAMPVVFVTTQSGKLVQVIAAGGSAGAATDLLNDPVQPFSPGPDGRLDIPAPTYADGIVFSSDGKGYLHTFDYFTGIEWTHPAPMPPRTMGTAHSPTVGYFYDPATGATDLAAYVPKRGVPGLVNGEVYTYRIKVFNERLRPVDPTRKPGVFKTRNENAPIMDAGGSFRLYYIKPNSPMGRVDENQVAVNQPGKGYFTINDPYFSSTVTTDATVYADYQIDYTVPGAPTRNIQIAHPANQSSAEGAGIEGVVASSKSDLLYFGSDNGSMYAVRDSIRGSEPTIVKWRWYLSQGMLGMGSPKLFGSPAIAGDMVYFAVNDGGNGYILAFRNDPVFSFNLNQPIKPGSAVRVKQIDLLSAGVNPPREIVFSSSTDEDDPNVSKNAPFVVDYESGRITLVNMRSGSNFLNASQDVTIEYTPEGDNAPVTEYRSAFAPSPGDKWNNLVWYVKLENEAGSALKVTSSPMIMGNTLYVGCSGGELVSMDVDGIGRGATGPPDMPVPMGMMIDKGYYYSQKITTGEIQAAPAGSHGMLAVATPDGLTIMHNPVTLIADGSRLVEVDAGGRVAWTCDGTTELRATTTGVGGDASRIYGAVKVPFNKPNVVRRAAVGGMVVADTGNNRIVHIDSGGNLLWQVTTFVDPNGLLPAGESFTLNRPMDVTMWTEQPPPANAGDPAYPEYRYLIADTGNYRVLEIAARYDDVSKSYRNELVWVSRSSAEGRTYQYVSVRQVHYEQAEDGDDPRALVCVVTNAVKESDVYSPGGALIRITNRGTPDEAYQAFVGLPLDPAAEPIMKFTRPTFFDRHYTSAVDYTDVVVDDNTLWLLDYEDDGSGNPVAVTPPFHFTPDMYYGPDGEKLPLAISYAQVLANGNVLVTNKATMGSSFFKGEVFEIDPTALPGDMIVGRMKAGERSYGLRQPSSAERRLY